MTRWSNPFKTKARRTAERVGRRVNALSEARSAVRRERRAVNKRQSKAEELRNKAVAYEQQGRPQLAKQTVKQFIQIDREALARTLAVNNMEYALEQVQIKDNYEAFSRGMELVANLEELAQQAVDPDVVRERIADMTARNQDAIEPWVEEVAGEPLNVSASTQMTKEEDEAYEQIVSEAAGALESEGEEFAQVDAELERKMDAAIAKE